MQDMKYSISLSQKKIRVEKVDNIDATVNQWIESSDKDFVSMQKLLAGKDYSMALFVGHQIIEKLLNAFYVKKHGIHALHIHDLLRLAREVDPVLPDLIEENLKGISIFNLNIHCDNYKQEFIRLCTLEFAEHWIDKIEILRDWLKAKLEQE